MAVAAFLPRGFISTEPIKDTVRTIVPEGWVGHPNLWLVACDLETGERVPFGREGSPPTDLAHAIAASCAIPGFYQPVKIDGRSYVDGGCWSPSNLDMLEGVGLDLVICLNPTSSTVRPRTWYEKARGYYRGVSGRRLGVEARRLRAAGTRVAILQPNAEDLVAMGPNLMRSDNLDLVFETAQQTVGAQLRSAEWREIASDLRRLSGREKPARERKVAAMIKRIGARSAIKPVAQRSARVA
jgi:NTE family protein